MDTKGYTLIEILVAVAVFTVVVAAPTGFFVSSIKGQQKALSSQELIDNTSYALEYMSRTLRMAKKETSCASRTDPSTCSCLDVQGYGFNYETTHSGKGIKFVNYQDICQEFYWDETDKKLKETKNGGVAVFLTPADVEVVSFKIGSTDSWDQADNEQAKVVLFLEVKGVKSQRPELQPVIKIQTTISQRNLDVQY